MSAAASERTFEVKNPANGATIPRAAEGDKVDIDAAVRAARRRSSRDPSSPAGAARWARRSRQLPGHQGGDHRSLDLFVQASEETLPGWGLLRLHGSSRSMRPYGVTSTAYRGGPTSATPM
jgi:hypothetical protein